MPTLPVYWHDAFLEHEAPAEAWALPGSDLHAVDEPHPERPERAENMKGAIEAELDEYATWETAERATAEDVGTVHEESLIRAFEEQFRDGDGGWVEHDGTPGFTGGNGATFEAVMRAVGAAVQVAERALDRGIDEVPYALCRPPGHHAQPTEFDGFCFFNQVAVAADRVLRTGQADRVAIVDWDVHHGNGTQEIFYDRDDVLFVSLHADLGRWAPWHPQTGKPEESGEGAGEGYNVNVPLPHGTGNVGYAHAFEELVEPVVAAYDPDLILVSNGLDPGRSDPLARMSMTKPGFRDLGRRVRRLAVDHADGHLGVVQEGGYLVSHLPYTLLGVFEGILDVDTGVEDVFDWNDTRIENIGLARERVRHARQVHAQQWPVTELGLE